MTTATQTGISQDVLQERWHMAVTELRQFEGEPAQSECNSQAMESLSDAVQEVAVRMVHEIHGPEEEAALEALWTEIADEIETEIKRFAIAIESARADAEKGEAA